MSHEKFDYLLPSTCTGFNEEKHWFSICNRTKGKTYSLFKARYFYKSNDFIILHKWVQSV
jgi:hypothetical protein